MSSHCFRGLITLSLSYNENIIVDFPTEVNPYGKAELAIVLRLVIFPIPSHHSRMRKAGLSTNAWAPNSVHPTTSQPVLAFCDDLEIRGKIA